MALKYGSSSKSSAFKRSAFPMQSGTTNHASAVKKVEEKDADRLKRLIEEKKTKEGLENIEGTPEYLKKLKQTNIRQGETDYIAEQKAKKEDALRLKKEEEAKKNVKPKEKTWQEKESEFRDLKSKNKGKKKTLREIQKDERKHLKTLKEEPDHKDLKKELRVEQKAERKMMRKKYRKENKAAKDEWTSDPAYKKHKKEVNEEEMRRTVAGLREYGPGGSGSQTEGKAKYDAAKLAQSNKEKTQASQDIRDARTKQHIEAYDANLKNENELASVPSAAGTEGDVNMTEQQKLAKGNIDARSSEKYKNPKS